MSETTSDLVAAPAASVTPTPEQTLEALGTIESQVAGRTRLRLHKELRTPETMAAIKEQLSSHEHVEDVSINPRTGSVVIAHSRQHQAETIVHAAFREAELVVSAVFELPESDEGESGYAKLDQQLADLVVKVNDYVYRKTGLRLHGEILAGTIASLGVAQILAFGISLEMLPGPVLLWIAWDIYRRVREEQAARDQNGAVTGDTPGDAAAFAIEAASASA